MSKITRHKLAVFSPESDIIQCLFSCQKKKKRGLSNKKCTMSQGNKKEATAVMSIIILTHKMVEQKKRKFCGTK